MGPGLMSRRGASSETSPYLPVPSLCFPRARKSPEGHHTLFYMFCVHSWCCLAKLCSPPHFHSQSPFFSSSLLPSVGVRQQQREGSGARQPVHRLLCQGRRCSMRQSPVSKVGRATGLPGLGLGEAEHTCNINCSAALFEAGDADQRSRGRLWQFALIAGGAFHAYSILPCDLSLPRVC